MATIQLYCLLNCGRMVRRWMWKRPHEFRIRRWHKLCRCCCRWMLLVDYWSGRLCGRSHSCNDITLRVKSQPYRVLHSHVLLLVSLARSQAPGFMRCYCWWVVRLLVVSWVVFCVLLEGSVAHTVFWVPYYFLVRMVSFLFSLSPTLVFLFQRTKEIAQWCCCCDHGKQPW